MGIKESIGLQLEKIRKDLGVTTYNLFKQGLHQSLPGKIEQNKGGYSIDTLEKYCNAIDKRIVFKIELEEK